MRGVPVRGATPTTCKILQSVRSQMPGGPCRGQDRSGHRGRVMAGGGWRVLPNPIERESLTSISSHNPGRSKIDTPGLIPSVLELARTTETLLPFLCWMGVPANTKPNPQTRSCFDLGFAGA